MFNFLLLFLAVLNRTFLCIHLSFFCLLLPFSSSYGPWHTKLRNTQRKTSRCFPQTSAATEYAAKTFAQEFWASRWYSTTDFNFPRARRYSKFLSKFYNSTGPPLRPVTNVNHGETIGKLALVTTPTEKITFAAKLLSGRQYGKTSLLLQIEPYCCATTCRGLRATLIRF